MEIRSSYKESDYSKVFKSLTFSLQPKLIVEFGILDGYSLQAFLDSRPDGCRVEAYDLFDEFPYNAADFEHIGQKFAKYDDFRLEKGNFFGSEALYGDNSIDILHVDIANNGDVYEYFFEKYLPKVAKTGICLLEGGSEERDLVDWMVKYEKPKITPVLQKYRNQYNILVLDDFPSLTIVSR